MARLDFADVLSVSTEGGEVRVNLGDAATGKGYAANAALFGSSDGFIGAPNQPGAGFSSATAVMATEGNERVVLAIRDTRFDTKAGALALGDRAIVSDCDASFFLDKSENTVELKATDDNSVKVDGDEETITLRRGDKTVVLTDSSLVATVGNGSIAVTDDAVTLQLGPLVLVLSGATVSIATQSGPPATLLVNGIAVIVP